MVIAMTERQTDKLKAVLDHWWRRFPPCSTSFSSTSSFLSSIPDGVSVRDHGATGLTNNDEQTDAVIGGAQQSAESSFSRASTSSSYSPPYLVIYIASPFTDTSPKTDTNNSLTFRINQLIPAEISSCFRSIKICIVHPPSPLDTHIEGARFLFESILKDVSCVPLPRLYILYAEPDLRPIKANWLSELDVYLKTSLPLDSWMAGAMFHGDEKKLGTTDYLFNKYHLNGAALLNLETRKSPNFVSFYFKQVRPFVESQGGSRNAYDTDIFEYLAHPSSYNFFRRYAAHKIYATTLILNFWRTPWTLQDLTMIWPEALFVHGGVPSQFESRDY